MVKHHGFAMSTATNSWTKKKGPVAARVRFLEISSSTIYGRSSIRRATCVSGICFRRVHLLTNGFDFGLQNGILLRHDTIVAVKDERLLQEAGGLPGSTVRLCLGG
jgi:hypothetical protein